MPGIPERWFPTALRAPDVSNPAARLERRVGRGIAVLVPVFAVIGAVVLFSHEGPATAIRRVICVVVLLSTVPVGAWWFRHAKRVDRMPGWFVFYADIGVTIVLLTFASRDMALYATVLFAVIGTYIAYFSSRRVLRAHSAFVSLVILGLAVATYIEGSHDALSVTARTLVALLVVNSVIVFSTVIKAQLDLANTDSLTGLLNRRGFELRLERLLRGSSDGQHIVVLVVDLDRFKNVNDTFGHAAGDRVLGSTATRLAEAVSEQTCVARTGGEEFTIAAGLDPAEALTLAERVRETIERSDCEIPITGSVGVSVLSVGDWKRLTTEDAAGMIHSALLRADTAMYEAKRAGGNNSKVFEE